MLVSITVVSTRILRPATTLASRAMATTRCCRRATASGPTIGASRPRVLASGTLPPPTRVNCRYRRFVRTSRSRIAKLQFRICFNSNSRRTTSAGKPGRPRVRLWARRATNASYTVATRSSSSSTWSTARIQSSQNSSTCSLRNPSANPRWACRRSRTRGSPPWRRGRRVRPQEPLIELADVLQGRLELLIVRQPRADQGHLLGPQAELAGAAPGVAHGQDPHRVAVARRALRAPAAMANDAFQQGAAHNLVQVGEVAQHARAGSGHLRLFHQDS